MQDAMNPDLPRFSELPPLLVVGAGKLGTAVAEAWERQGGTVALRISAGQQWQPEGLVFEATAPDAALGNLLRCAEARPLVAVEEGVDDVFGLLAPVGSKWRGLVFRPLSRSHSGGFFGG